MARRLCRKKVLVVLDNIDHVDQLKYLAGDLGWFGNGSRIIATTRDKNIIGENDAKYTVTTLFEHDAVKLFNQNAFKDKVPGKCFEEMTLEVVRQAQGLPLALEVWGSSFRKKDISWWRSAVDRLKKNFNPEIVGKLRVSYDGLAEEEQTIFLDIACFLKGRKQTKIKRILESCDFGAVEGLGKLIDKSLVSISEEDGTIQMHDLIQEMGKHIVKVQKKMGELSRLWRTEDFEEFSKAEIQETKAIEAIWVQEIQDLTFSEKAMENVKNLRILYINGFHTHDGSNDQYLPSKLCWFDCCKYPWESLPAKFDPGKLVRLYLRQSSLRHLWTETKSFPVLRRLDLSGCENLKETPDFTNMPKLVYLSLEECSKLTKVHHSLENSKKLRKLNLRDCKRLVTFECVSGVSLEYLCIQGCSRLEKFPSIKEKGKREKRIHVQCSGLSELPSAMIEHQSSLTNLDLSGMKNLEKLSRSIGKLKHLVMLKLSYCSKLSRLPKEIGDLENLEILEARYTLISKPPSSIVRLNKLKSLTFEKDKSEYGVNFVFPPVSEGLRSLEKLDLSYCNLKDGGLPEDIRSLSSLKELNLSGNNFEYLPRSIAQLGALEYLDLSDCKRLTQLPEDIGSLSSLKELNLSYCNIIDGGLLDNIGSLSSLKKLNLRGNNFEHLPQSMTQLGSLHSLNLLDCKSLTQLPTFQQQLDTEYGPSNDSIYNSLFHHTSSSAAGSRILLRSLKHK